MSYAVRKDGQGWRAVNGQDDVGSDESYSETQPIPDPILKAQAEKSAMLKVGRSMRESVLARLNGIHLDAIVANDTATATAVATAKQQLKDITTWPAVVSAISGEETKVAFLTRYYQIAHELQAAAPYAVTAFTGLDL